MPGNERAFNRYPASNSRPEPFGRLLCRVGQSAALLFLAIPERVGRESASKGLTLSSMGPAPGITDFMQVDSFSESCTDLTLSRLEVSVGALSLWGFW